MKNPFREIFFIESREMNGGARYRKEIRMKRGKKRRENQKRNVEEKLKRIKEIKGVKEIKEISIFGSGGRKVSCKDKERLRMMEKERREREKKRWRSELKIDNIH